MKKFVQLLLTLCIWLPLMAQQPQTQVSPISALNAKYVNGVAPGYYPIKGSGLTLNVGAGTSDCAGTPTMYAGGTLTMTASTTNYIYLNTASSCVPATKTTAFTAADIPLAEVVTSSSTITGVSDVRTMFNYSPSSGMTAASVGALFGCSGTDPFLTYSGGCSSSSTATQRGVDAGVVAGLSASATDNSSSFLSMMSTYCATKACEVYVPCGIYKFTNSGQIPVTSTTYRGIRIIGEGRGVYSGTNCVEFEANAANIWPIWFDNTTADAGNSGGPDIENITFIDNNGNAAGGLRFTQINYGLLWNLGFENFSGTTDYTTGNITVTNGSNTATCSSCTLSSQMDYGFLWVKGEAQEISSVSGTTITLSSNWEYPTCTSCASANWNIDYNGVGVMFEGSSVATGGYSQYWAVYNIYSFGTRLTVDNVGGHPGSTDNWGTSRINFLNGGINCQYQGDSMAMFTGRRADTMRWYVPSNNCAVHVLMEETHANQIEPMIENDTQAPIFSINGGVAAQQYNKGVVFNFASYDGSYGNVVMGGKIYQVGNGVEFNNDTVITGSSTEQILGVSMVSNTHNQVWLSGATCNTQGSTVVHQPDCEAMQATQMSLNGVLWATGSGAPSGSCTAGSIYSNTSGGAGTTIYGCYASAWHDIL